VAFVHDGDRAVLLLLDDAHRAQPLLLQGAALATWQALESPQGLTALTKSLGRFHTEVLVDDEPQRLDQILRALERVGLVRRIQQ
jgi:hypothetical protein